MPNNVVRVAKISALLQMVTVILRVGFIFLIKQWSPTFLLPLSYARVCSANLPLIVKAVHISGEMLLVDMYACL